MEKAPTAQKGNVEALTDLLDSIEVAEAQRQQRAMLRAALGEQYSAWSKKRKKDQTNERY
jgi:hypothetical protein